MQVNVEFLKAERQKRAWSQEQLAAAAGLGLRTIQRIESSGTASNETIKSLAAVFDCSVQDVLSSDVAARRNPFWKRSLPIGAAASLVLVLTVLMLARATAGEVMLDVVLGGDDANAKVFKLMAAEGQSAEARVDQELRIVLTPSLQRDDLILLYAEIYAYDGKEYKLLSTPKVLTRSGKDAKIQVGLGDGKSVQMSVNPKRM